MSPRLHRRVWKASLAILLGAIIAWFIPSYFSAERYRHRLEAGLERVLHRRVNFSEVSIRLLPRPGFVIRNAVVEEDPAFGTEPFTRVDQIECDVSWRTLAGSRLDFSHFHFQHPNINLVRMPGEGWNVERFLLQMAVLPAADGTAPRSSAADSGRLDIEVDDARINFKLGENKKPLAITDLSAHLSLDRAHNHLQFRVTGYPVRSDLSLPTPGAVEVEGGWTPTADLRGPLDVQLRTRGALLYDWAPLVTGHNTTLYGVMDTDVRLTGSIRALRFQGSGRVSDLHRWDQIPPSNSSPVTTTFRGQVDRDRGQVLLDDVEAAFSGSHVRIAGTIEQFVSSPDLDLVVTLERSRLEDLAALAGQVWAVKGPFAARGRVDGMLSIRGPWTDLHYGGFVGAREVVLRTSSASFPVSEIAIRIDNRGARLTPVRVSLAPHVILEAEGLVDRLKHFRYDLTLSVKAAPLREVLSLGRELGVGRLEGWDAVGSGTASFHVAGPLGVSFHPLLNGRAELRSARLIIPGFTGPVNVPQASVLVDGNQIVVDRVVAVLGTSVFFGRFEQRDGSGSPWSFNLHTRNLDAGQGASWFVVLGQRKPLPLLQRLRGLSLSAADRAAASNLFASLNAQGQFSASTLTYRDATLKDFKANVEIARRVIRIANATFHSGGGQGSLTSGIDLTRMPARVTTDVSLSGGAVRELAAHFLPVLRGAHGSMSLDGHFDTVGLSSESIIGNLNGRVTVATSALSLAGFDPVGAFVRRSGAGSLEPSRGPVELRPLTLDLRIHDRRVDLKKTVVECSGAKLGVSGTCAFDRSATLQVAADLRRVRRRWLERTGKDSLPRQLAFTGVLDNLAPIPDTGLSGAKR